MASVKLNVFANFLGRGCESLLGIVFIPLYVRYLGAESYGLVGMFGIMQAWLVILDMGMTATLTREMARFTAGKKELQSICNLLRTLEIVFLGLMTFVAGLIYFFSSWFAHHWFQIEALSVKTVEQSLAIMGLVVALRFFEGIYRGTLVGLQKQLHLNVISTALAIVRHLGAVIVLVYFVSTIQAFFIWQGVTSLLSIIIFALVSYRQIASPPEGYHFVFSEIKQVKNFAGGMTVITLLALLLTNVDKILLSRLLALKDFGYYTLATTVTGVLYTLINPITQAVYPRFVELVAKGDDHELGDIYHKVSQFISVLAAPITFLVFFFAEGILFMWSGDISLSKNVSPILSVLIVGTFLNVQMWVPYQCQLAYGWTSLMAKVNFVAVCILVPAVFLVVPEYGAIGAAYIWVILNGGYVFAVIQLQHRKILKSEKISWYLFDLILPVMGSFIAVYLFKLFAISLAESRVQWFLFLLFAGIFSTFMSLLMAKRTRIIVVDYLFSLRLFHFVQKKDAI